MTDWSTITTPERCVPRVCCCKGKGFVNVAAPVGHPLFGVAIPCRCRTDELARERALRMVALSGTTEADLARSTFETFKLSLCQGREGGPLQNGDYAKIEAVVRTCREFAARPDGWLVLVGPTGSGKTHLAKAIVNVLLGRGEQAYVATVSRMLDTLRGGFESGEYRQFVETLEQVSLLVLDDLGSERATDWTREVMLGIVDTRLRNRRPMLVTMNVPPDSKGMERRLGSRLTEGAGVPDGWSRVVVMPCGDARRGIGRA